MVELKHRRQPWLKATLGLPDATRFLRGRASGRQRAMRDLDSRVHRLVRCSERRGATVENELELDSDLVSSIQIWWLD